MSDDSRFLVSGAKDGSLRIFDFKLKQPYCHLKDSIRGSPFIDPNPNIL